MGYPTIAYTNGLAPSEPGGAEPASAKPGGAEPEGAELGGAESEGAESGGAEPEGAEPEGAEPGGAEPMGAEPGGAGSEGAESKGAEPRGTVSASLRLSHQREPLSPQQLHLGVGGTCAGARGTGAGGAGATILGGAGVTAGAGGTRGAGAASPRGARTQGTGAGGAGGVGGTGVGDHGAGGTRSGGAGAGGAGAGGAGARGAKAGDPGAGGAGTGGAGAGGTRVGDPGARGAGAGDPGAGGAGAWGAGAGGTGAGGNVQRQPFFLPPPPFLLLPPPHKSQPQLQPDSPLPDPSPYAEQTYSLTERRQPESCPASPVRDVRTSHHVPRLGPPPIPSTYVMALRPSSVPLRVPLPSPPESSLADGPDPESDLVRSDSPIVPRLLATIVTDPLFESAAASALVAELVEFAAACRLGYAASLVAGSESDCPLSVGGECALGTDVLEDRETWMHQTSRPRALTQRRFRGVDFFQTFSPTTKMNTLRVVLHVAAQHDYELHFLDFNTNFLQGSLHEEIWLCHPHGFTGSFPAGTWWSLRRPVYGLRQVPREWHDTLRTTLAALRFAPWTADPSLFLRTDTSLPPFYILVYVDDLVFATVDIEALALVKSELEKRHTCTDLGGWDTIQVPEEATERTTGRDSGAVEPTEGDWGTANAPNEWGYPEAPGLPPEPVAELDPYWTTRSTSWGGPPLPDQYALDPPEHVQEELEEEVTYEFFSKAAELPEPTEEAPPPEQGSQLISVTSDEYLYHRVPMEGLPASEWPEAASFPQPLITGDAVHSGDTDNIASFETLRDWGQCGTVPDHCTLALQVLQRFDFTYSSPQATPLSTRHSLSALPSDESVEPSGPYPELVGCLMYLMTCTRPDLAYPLSILARYVAPGRHRPEHMAAAKRVLRYLCSTSGMGLVLGGRRPVVLTGHADASWADDQATQRSSQGYTFSLGSGSVSWRSTRSSSVLSSSCEAEIYAGAMAAQELRWLTYLLTDLGEQPRSPPVLYVDNKAMLALCREHRLEHRTKHIALRYFLARELQQRGQLRLAYVASEANTADIFTNALAPGDHQRFCTLLACFALLDWSCDLLFSPTLPMGVCQTYML
ncbi:unnamed protein product [Closterium sp. NIES-53]